MSKVIVSEFLTLDGVMDDPGGGDKTVHGGWSMPYWHPDIGQFKLDELIASGALLLGRVTYQGFAAAWPGRTDEAGFADRMNSLPKHVVSTTLETVEWNNSHLIAANVAETIATLKAETGQDILINGSGQLVHSLIPHGLIDEYRLLVYPIIVGSGKHLFPEGGAANLKLVETRSFPTGVVLLRYQPAEAAKGV